VGDCNHLQAIDSGAVGRVAGVHLLVQWIGTWADLNPEPAGLFRKVASDGDQVVRRSETQAAMTRLTHFAGGTILASFHPCGLGFAQTLAADRADSEPSVQAHDTIGGSKTGAYSGGGMRR
jgi:hypothetical protein